MKNLSGSLEEVTEKSLNLDTAINVSAKSVTAIRMLSRSLGWPHEVSQILKSNVHVILNTLESSLQDQKIFERILNKRGDSEFGSLAVLISYIASGIARSMEWSTPKNYYKLTMAAFLHDITLSTDELNQAKAFNNLIYSGGEIDERMQKYMQHPIEAAAIAEKVTNDPTDIVNVIMQHHEQANGKGFPNNISHQQIAPLSSIFIVAEHLANQLWKNNTPEDLGKFLEANQIKYSDSYFKKIYKVLYKQFATARS